MSRDLIAERLKKAMGLHAPTVGMTTISSAIDTRMREINIDNDAKYLTTIISNHEEMKELIEAVLIPETWFFRENQPYQYILKYFYDNPTKKINILSIPCSTGEEPYSIAMMLMDNNIGVDAFRIDAVDIGENNIARAKKGQYRKNSFRTDDLSFMDKYFHEQDNLFNLAGFVKNQVNFHCENVLSSSFKLNANQYDIILCRNLLIYFDSDTQYKMFCTIDEMLKPKGILILGQAETNQNSQGLFVPAVDCKSYIYVKQSNHIQSLPHLQQMRRQKLSAPRPAVKNKISRPFSDVQKTTVISETKPADSNDNLDVAFKFANEGRLDEALSICKDYIKHHIDSSKAYYLSGIIYDNKGDIEKSEQSLRKAIYLDPQNVEALIHLSLIAEQCGNHDESIRYKQRAQRVKERHSV